MGRHSPKSVRIRRVSLVSALAALSVVALAAGAAQQESTAPALHSDAASKRVIDLSDGGRLEIGPDGTMRHYDADGIPVLMHDGEIMTTEDGVRILIKGEALWRQLAERAAADYALASTFPWQRDAASEPMVELADGGRIELRADGTKVHLDASGNRVDMKDGEPMTTKDGTRIMMRARALWSTIVDSVAPPARP